MDLKPPRQGEVGKVRRSLVVSSDDFNKSGRGWAAVLPITTNTQPVAARVKIFPPEGGQNKPGSIMCDAVRVLSFEVRFKELVGAVKPETMEKVEERLRLVLELD